MADWLAQRSRWVALLLLVAALLLIGGIYLGHVFTCAIDRCPPGAPDGSGGLHLAGPASVRIVGHASRPMRPGDRVPLNLTLSNNNDFAVIAAHLAVAVQTLSAPRATHSRACSVRDFIVGQASSDVTVTLAAHQSTTLRAEHIVPKAWPQLGMLDASTNQDGCKGASLQLHYSASGTRVDR
jgi:hypothetical protein